MNSARIEQLKRMLKETPDDPFLHYALALEHVDESPVRAREIFEKLLTQFADYLPAYYHAAHLFWTLEEFEKAAETFDRGIELAIKVNDQHALRELRNARMNFEFDTE